MGSLETEMAFRQVTFGDMGEKDLNQSRVPLISEYFNHSSKIRLDCGYCKKEYEKNKSQIRGRLNFCSIGCKAKWQHIHSVGDKSPTWKGGLISIKCSQCGVIIKRKPSLIIPYKEHFCSKICMSKWRSTNLRGFLSPRWRGGITIQRKLLKSNANYFKWRDEIYRKDNYTCQMCGYYSRYAQNLHAHHKVPISKSTLHIYDVSNGITLCIFCHGLIHSRSFVGIKRIRKCPACGVDFFDKDYRQIYCSWNCFVISRRSGRREI